MLVCALCRPSRSPAFPLAVAGASSGRQSRRAAPPPPWAPGRFCLPSLPPGLGCGPGRGCRGREGAGVWGRWVAGRALFASGVHAARPERTRRPRGPSRFTSGFRAHAPPLMRVAWPFRRPVRPPLAALCGPSRAPYLLGAPRVGPARARSFAHPPPLVLARVRGLSRRADSAPASPARRGPGRGRRRRPPAQKGAGPPPPPLFPPGVPGRRPGRVAPGAMGAGQLATRATPGVPRCRRPLPTWGGGARGGRGSFQEKGQNAVKLGILFVSFEQALLSAGLGGRRATKNALRVTCFGCFGFEMIGFRLN